LQVLLKASSSAARSSLPRSIYFGRPRSNSDALSLLGEGFRSEVFVIGLKQRGSILLFKVQSLLHCRRLGRTLLGRGAVRIQGLGFRV
jgi:hypothetical protein